MCCLISEIQNAANTLLLKVKTTDKIGPIKNMLNRTHTLSLANEPNYLTALTQSRF